MVAPGATLVEVSYRVFKTAWFARSARKALITDEELCSASAQASLGLADDLGGGVFKKRLRRNEFRSIILARAGQFWVFEYLFAKQDRANIDAHELTAFRKLVKVYAQLTNEQVNRLLIETDWMEICNAAETKISK